MFPCGTGPPQKIVKCAYGGLAYFRCILESRSRIVRCFRIGHLACKEYRIKVVTWSFRAGWQAKLRKRNDWRPKNKYCRVITFWYSQLLQRWFPSVSTGFVQRE